MKTKLPLLLLGIILGVIGALLWPRFVTPHLPAGLAPSMEAVDGVVLRKAREDERLLLTIETAQGAALATFTEKVPEIDILVDEGDAVTLALPAYEPFVENPAIRGVRKGAGAVAAEPPPSEEPAESPDAAAPAAELEDWPGEGEDG